MLTSYIPGTPVSELIMSVCTKRAMNEIQGEVYGVYIKLHFNAYITVWTHAIFYTLI